jgi:hypothetical protein
VNPHPLWIVAAAIAARYGRRAGYFAGALAAVAYGALAITHSATPLMSIDSQIFLQPLLIAITGAALGELTDARERRLAGVEDRARSLEETIRGLWNRYRAVDKVKAELEKRIAFSAAPTEIATAHGVDPTHNPGLAEPPDRASSRINISVRGQ